ncbi:MAG: type I methionyl aminopeptidase [Actinobacteria bacterium]|nr:type I methionyl aminopeptidase [Actinomycetota bacterium]
MIICKSASEIDKMREAGKIVAEVFVLMEKLIKPGVTTAALNGAAEDYIVKRKGRAAFKGYKGFPAAICTSINNEVVHGIPGPRRLKSGDIVSIDAGVEYNGYYSDGAITFPVGKISKEAEELIEVAKRALNNGLNQCIIGKKLFDISNAIQVEVEKAGCSVVRDFVGHGIGRSIHEDPQVPNFGESGKGPKLEEGMVFAIEPMVNRGSYEVEILEDGWTVITKDRSLSAHFEHTVTVTKDKPLILTEL